jgi:tRNA threonylcarbamoyladenosine biosynthesis protein TsaB
MAQKPLILAVETSSRIGSVAIALGEQILAEAAFSGPMRHSAELFPAIRSLLERFSRKPQEIDHIYISVGPGSFTGLRIAVTMAKAMHLANPPQRTKIIAVDTRDVIAANAIDYIKKKNTEFRENRRYY